MPTPAVERALAYPFDPPAKSYVFRGGAPVFIDQSAFAPHLTAAMSAPRHAVIASGSNASPKRLFEKFGDGEVIPVLRARIEGLIVTHSAKFTGYGSMPATLHRHPGGSANVFVTLLDDDQLARMDQTEALGVEYDRAAITAPIAIETGAQPDDVMAYVSRYGAFAPSGAPAPSAAADQSAPELSPITQAEAVQAAMRVADVKDDLHAFLGRVIRDAAYRGGVNQQLKARAALPFDFGGE